MPDDHQPSSPPAKSRRQPHRLNLGIGEFEWTAASLNSREYARDIYLEAIREQCPEVVADLARLGLDACRRLLWARLEAENELSPEDWEEIQDDRIDVEPLALALRNAVGDWQRTWRLTDSWMRPRALATLAAWAVGMPQGDWYPEALSTGGGKLAGDPPFTFQAPAWAPISQQWEDWKADTGGRMQKQLQVYRQRRESEALAAGMVRTQERFEDHFRSLVRYQVKKENYGPIADSVDKTRKAISSAVHNLAQLLDLKLRPPQKGRPQKK